MPLFTESSVRASAQRVLKGKSSYFVRSLLEAKQADLDTQYDIFLSHSFRDSELVFGLGLQIEEMGYSFYIDWVTDAELDRAQVCKDTAARLKTRMQHCRCLFFATSSNSPVSKWMPWECGYFDGINGKIAICPLAEQEWQYTYQGQEYLGLYPYVTKDLPEKEDKLTLWVRESKSKYMIFDAWLEGVQPFERQT